MLDKLQLEGIIDWLSLAAIRQAEAYPHWRSNCAELNLSHAVSTEVRNATFS